MRVGQMCSNSSPVLTSSTEFIAGTEYEIESVKEITNEDGDTLDNSLTENTFWQWNLGWMKDGSLRNSGIEVVTKPCNFLTSLKEFERVHHYVKVGSDAYSHRTSTHVHVNVQNLTLDQVKTLMLLYALYEQMFFSYVGMERQNNIHCVPLNYTYLPSRYSRPIKELIEGWSKYTAFNLLPVSTLGTVEFRHLYGTGDVNRYKAWLTKLRDLWQFVYDMPTFNLHEFFLADGNLMELGNSIFTDKSITEDSFRNSVIDVKLAFV